MSNTFFSFFSKKENADSQAIKTLSPEMFAFLQQFPTAILLLNALGKIVFANAAAASILQVEEKVLKGEGVERFGLTMPQVRAMADSKDLQKTVIQLVNPKADVVYVSAGASFLASTPFIMLTLEEVPHFKQLNAEKSFLRSVIDGYPVPVTVQNLTAGCVLWNLQAEKLFGFKASQTLGNPVYNFLPKEIVPSLQRLDEEILKQKQTREKVSLSYKNAKGEERILSVSKLFLLSEKNKIQAIITIYEDVTSRQHYEQDLLQNRNLLRAVLDNVPLGLYTRDCDNEMTFFNRKSMEVLGETDVKCVNKPHPHQNSQDVDFHRMREEQVLREGKIKEFPQEEYIDHEGNKKILHLIKIPLMDAGPKPLVLSIVEDITERMGQQQEVSRANSFLTAILQNAPIGLYVRAANGRMLLRNKQCERIFGEVSDSSFDSRGSLPHETPEQVQEYIARERVLLDSGETLDIPEEEYVTGSGKKKRLHMIKVPVKGEKEEEQFVVTLVEDITDKKEQESTLIETKNFLQTLLDQVPVAIYARGLNDKISFINRRAHELFPDEQEYQAKDDFYGQREKAIFKDGKIVEIPEEWYTTFRGKKILLHLIKAPVFDKEGKPFMVLTVAEDITEKKAQEKAVIDAKNFLQTVINNLPVSLSVKDYDGKYILWNKKSEDLFGVMAESVIGRTSYRADINKDQAEFLRESDLRVFESKKEVDIPQELISTASEGVKIMHTVKTPVFNVDGTPNCLLVVSEDITAKTKMEKQIREASDKNTLLVENAREGIVILEDGKIIYANRALCKILDYEEVKELVGKNILDMAVEDHRPFLKDKYDAVLAGADDASSAIDVHFLNRSGLEVETEFAAISSKYLGRRIVLCFVRDVTKANRMLREVKTERSYFRSAFEKSLTPAFLLSYKGYISAMNESCRKLFGFTEADRNFYRNVYMKPALSWAVRSQLKSGHSAHMEYVFDFDRAAKMFPGRIVGTGKMPFSVSFVPINKRDAKDGTVEADYVVFLEKQDKAVVAPLPPAAPAMAEKKMQEPSQPPAPPAMVISKTAQEMLVLPNSEPYVLCSENWKIEVCNDLFCSLCQLTKEELIGQNLQNLFTAESLPRLEEDLKTLHLDGALSNREYHINLGSGLENTAIRLTAIKEADGRYLFVLRNMAFHRQIMRILEERSAQLNALLEATEGVVFSVLFENGRFGHIEQANKFLSRKLGYSHDELVHMPFKDLFFDRDHNSVRCKEVLAQAEEKLALEGKTVFKLSIRRKDGSFFASQVVVTALDLPNKDAALVVVRDLAEEWEDVSKESKEAQELKSVRQALPGLYLKTNSDGRVLEVYSNLDYLDNKLAADIFLNKTPGKYWPEEASSRALFAIKEAVSINVSTHFEFEWTVSEKVRYFEATVTPITGRAEAVLWIKDVSERRAYDAKIHELYRLASGPGLSITEQVDKILAFGLKTFQVDAGLVIRFDQGNNGLESHVVYATENDLQIERYMSFPVEECLVDVLDGNVVIFSDLEETSCCHCLHKEKGIKSLLAAPLYVSGKPQGALCFVSKTGRRNFGQGAEELMGIMSRLLSLRIELRETGKMLSEASRSLARTLEYVEMPAVMLDLDYRVSFANKAFLDVTGRRISNITGRDFFAEVIRNEDISKRMFKSAEKSSSGNAFQVRLDLLHENGLYEDTVWDVFACKNAEGKIDGYALVVSAS